MKFIEIARRMAYSKIVSIQNEYSLLCRLFDTDLAELCHHENVQLLSYSPLAAGLLTGKYQDNKIPKGSRLEVTVDSSPNLSGRIGPNTLHTVETYLEIAKSFNIDPIHMALAFCAAYNVSPDGLVKAIFLSTVLSFVSIILMIQLL